MLRCCSPLAMPARWMRLCSLSLRPEGGCQKSSLPSERPKSRAQARPLWSPGHNEQSKLGMRAGPSLPL